MSSYSFRVASVIVFAWALRASVAAAQTPPPPPPVSSPLDSAAAVVELRPVETISQEMQDSAELKAGAEARISAAKSMQVRADTEIKVKEAQLETIKAEIDQAKKAKNGLEQQDFEARKKLAELEKSLLQRRKTLRDREIKYWEASRDHFDIRRKYFEAELELANKRAQVAGVMSEGSSMAVYEQAIKLQHELQELERKVLNIEVAAAEKRSEVSKLEVEMSKARKQIFDAQNKLRAGG